MLVIDGSYDLPAVYFVGNTVQVIMNAIAHRFELLCRETSLKCFKRLSLTSVVPAAVSIMSTRSTLHTSVSDGMSGVRLDLLPFHDQLSVFSPMTQIRVKSLCEFIHESTAVIVRVRVTVRLPYATCGAGQILWIF